MLTWGSRERSDRGAAVVETALCVCFIVLPLVFGTISYAYMLSFRQTVSQSAAEGARAAAVAPASADRIAAATNAINAAMGSGSGALTCGSGYLTCTITTVQNCGDGSSSDCIKVTVSYPYNAHPMLPSMPGLGILLPQNISYSAMAQIN